jgi:hypothetical protein
MSKVQSTGKRVLARVFAGLERADESAASSAIMSRSECS